MSATTERRRAKPLTERAKTYPSNMLEYLSAQEARLARNQRSSERTRADHRRLCGIWDAELQARRHGHLRVVTPRVEPTWYARTRATEDRLSDMLINAQARANRRRLRLIYSADDRGRG